MEAALKELISSGALGAMLVVVLLMLGWLVRVLVTSFIRQTESVTKAMSELVEASRAIRDNCRACRTDSVSSIRDAQTGIMAHIDHVVWAAHDKGFGENERLIGAATEKISVALTGVVQSIRESNKDMEKKGPK